MLGNVAALWVTMLAAMKLGLVAHPGDAAARAAPISPTGSRAASARFIVADGADGRQIRRDRGDDVDPHRGRRGA